MSAHIARAEMLLQQSRPADAEREAGLALALNPQDPYAHALMALARIEQKRAAEALEPAETAIGLAPDFPYFHRVRAQVLHLLDRDKEALGAVDEAIRLDPEEEDSFSLRASIHLALRDWNAALADAEAGLALNPEDVRCANMRALALVRLGRKEEAAATVGYALERAPENAFSHANQGWTCLHRNDPKQAQVHFREALRLSPDMEFARQGMLEALKARNPIYRGILAYYLWMGRQSGRTQWIFIIGIYITMRLMRSGAESSPVWGKFLWPVMIAFYAFIYLSWTAHPMFNLLLRLDRFGRFVLSREERAATNWYGASVAVLAGCLTWWAFSDGEDLFPMFVSILAAMLSVCAAASFSGNRRRQRVLGWFSLGLTACALLFVGMVVTGGTDEAFVVLGAFFLGFLGFQITANVVGR
jgi:Tfp pilus assembly protein PilF